MRLSLVVPALAVVMALPLASQAADKAAAEALVKEGVDFLRKNGREAFFKEVNMGSGRFHVKPGNELYLFVNDEKGTTMANGFNGKLVGGNRWNTKDPDGKAYVQEYTTKAKAGGSTWVNYKYANPANGKIEEKSTFVMYAEGLLIGCGVYKR